MNRFSIIPSAAVFDKRLSPRDLTVLSAIGIHADKDGWCYPSAARLGEMLGVSRQAVQKSVRVLVGCEYIETRSHFRADGGQASNRIRVLFDTEQPESEMREVTNRRGGPPATSEVAPPATPGVAPPATSEVAPPATSEVAHNVPYNDPKNVKKRRASATHAPAVEKPAEVTDQTWLDWLTLRKAKKAPVTETVLQNAIREAQKAGLPLEDFFIVWCARGSQGLMADWIKPDRFGGRGGMHNGPYRESVADRAARLAREGDERERRQAAGGC